MGAGAAHIVLSLSDERRRRTGGLRGEAYRFGFESCRVREKWAEAGRIGGKSGLSSSEKVDEAGRGSRAT